MTMQRLMFFMALWQEGISSKFKDVAATLEDIIVSRAEEEEEVAEKTSVDSSHSQEIERLKSALSIVSGLAKQAHQATITERQSQAEIINSLQNRLKLFEK